MYNLGIKNPKIQKSTLESVKYLDNMREELDKIVVTSAVDR